MPIFIAILSAIIYHNLYHNPAFTEYQERRQKKTSTVLTEQKKERKAICRKEPGG